MIPPHLARLVIAIVVLAVATSSPAGQAVKTRKPRLDLRATPRFSFTPSTVFLTADMLRSRRPLAVASATVTVRGMGDMGED